MSDLSKELIDILRQISDTGLTMKNAYAIGHAMSAVKERDSLRAELACANERTQIQIDQANEHFKKMEAAGHAIEAELRDVRAQLTEWQDDYAALKERAEKVNAQIASMRKALQPFAACVFNDNGEVTITTSDLRVHDYMRVRSALTDD